MNQLDPAQARRLNRILWLALVASQVVYIAVNLSGAAATREQPLDLPVFPIVLGFIAAATAIGAHLSWRRASGAGQPIHLTPAEPATAFTFYVLAWTLDCSIAIYGLLLGLLAFPPEAWGPFSAAAVLLILLHRPA
jgi:hypothetical protein